MSATSPAGQLSAESVAWHARFVAAIVSRDVAVYASFLHPECTLQINNALPVYSKRAIERAYGAYVAAFRTLAFDVLEIYGADHKFAAEALLTHACHDGKTEVVQCAYLIDRGADELITSVRVYGNASRLLRPFMRTAV